MRRRQRPLQADRPSATDSPAPPGRDHPVVHSSRRLRQICRRDSRAHRGVQRAGRRSVEWAGDEPLTKRIYGDGVAQEEEWNGTPRAISKDSGCRRREREPGDPGRGLSAEPGATVDRVERRDCASPERRSRGAKLLRSRERSRLSQVHRRRGVASRRGRPCAADQHRPRLLQTASRSTTARSHA